MAVLPTGIGPVSGYQIQRSLRFSSADSAYLNRTQGTSTNQSIGTWSFWYKRATLGTIQRLFEGYTASSDTGNGAIEFGSDNKLYVGGFSTNWRVTTQVFRDPSAWYHFVIAVDTTQATANNRLKIYVNGSEVTAFDTTNNPTQNSTFGLNNNSSVLQIGRRRIVSSNDQFLDAYLTEINFIDGQALTPSSFGQTNASTGVWEPVRYTGTYGTNGFYLNFSDNSNTTNTTLGKDSSGNGNNWTPNNFSVTAGAGNDSLVDTPTTYGTDTGVGGEVRGNYATWNPLYGSTPILANGNLDATTNNTTAYGTVSVTSGKWYWEILVGNAGYIGVMDSTYIKPDGSWSSQAIAYVSSGNKYNGTGSAYGASYTTNDIIGVALDMDAGTIVFYKNGSSQGTAFSSGIAGKEFRPFVYSLTSGTQTANFGQRPFAYTAPSGFKALCTQNLPPVTIGATSTTQAGKYMNAVLYTGNGSTQSITGVGFQPDLLWIKNRNGAQNNYLQDAVRGATNYLVSNNTGAENQYSGVGVSAVTAFVSDGFSLGTDAIGMANTNTLTYVAWNWNAGGSNQTISVGQYATSPANVPSIASTVRANTTAGFSIVTYTGTGANATVGHGLGVAPKMVIIKARNQSGVAYSWVVWQSALTGTEYLLLNSTAAKGTAAAVWNSSIPTSTVINLGTDATLNGNTVTYVAYCFAAVAGYSAFGSYTGNGSADGPFVYTGFRPRFVLIKASGLDESWYVYDSTRNTYNVVDLELNPNNSGAEATFTTLDFVSNGFKIRTTNSAFNTNGATYIYAAFAESPFKYSLAR